MSDVVHAPDHYMLFDDLEAIDAIYQLLTEEEFQGYLRGCELEYRFRAGLKDKPEQDIAKAMKYREFRQEVYK